MCAQIGIILLIHLNTQIYGCKFGIVDIRFTSLDGTLSEPPIEPKTDPCRTSKKVPCGVVPVRSAYHF